VAAVQLGIRSNDPLSTVVHAAGLDRVSFQSQQFRNGPLLECPLAREAANTRDRVDVATFD